MPKASLFTIAPHARFLPTLVEAILDGTLLPDWPRTGPFWLADLTIFLPGKRARLALIDRFAGALGGAALMPAIRTLGEEEDGAAFFDDEVPDTVAAHPVARQLVLARLVEAWVATEEHAGIRGFASPPSAAEIVALGGALGRLIDDFEIEEIDVSALEQIVPADLAENWQRTLQFLQIVLKAWPEHLAERGEADHSRLRRRRIDREAESLSARYAGRPVIAAGSTGSIKATARLIAAIARLEHSAVVLPGLDTELDEKSLTSLRDADANPHTHPQYGLSRLLEVLGTAPGGVVELAARPATRTVLVRRALTLADATGEWSEARRALGARKINAATEGLALAVAETPHHEARTVAVAAHKALLDAKSVGIVSPDRLLARRIAHELERFQVHIEDSAGTPLAQSRAARLMRLAVRLLAGAYAPVDLAALLASPHVELGLGRSEVARRRHLLELAALRGLSPGGGLAGFRARIADNLAGLCDRPLHLLTEAEAADVIDLVDRLEAALSPLAEALSDDPVSMSRLAPSVAETLDALRAPSEGSEKAQLAGEDALAGWLALIAESASAPRVRPRNVLDSLMALMADQSVPPDHPGRPDIAIWGRIEARLQSADVTILAGLNEDIWPGTADPGPWLSRGMRQAAGLEPPERRIGLAAHDFEMALGAGEVLMTCSRRIGAGPADPSRFVQRLTGFLGEKATQAMRQRGEAWLALARALDHVEAPQPIARPAPVPPAALRPRRLSVTEIETLIRDPYAVYARHVLRLKPLTELGKLPDAADRGSLIHDILGGFIAAGGDPLAPDALDALKHRAAAAFAGLGDAADVARLWGRRFAAIAVDFLAWERARADRVAARHAEVPGRAELTVEGARFTLAGRADRIDEMRDGSLEIIDFKTGSVPDRRTMNDRLAPQLPMEALIARHGGFEGVAAAQASALIYLKLAHGPGPIDTKHFAIDDLPLPEAIDDQWRRVSHHIALFLNSADRPLYSHLMAEPAVRYERPYDHLARVLEWSSVGPEET